MATEGRIRQKKLENQMKLEAKLNELEVLTTTTMSTTYGYDTILHRFHMKVWSDT